MILHHGSFLIRISTDLCLFAAPRGFSQLVTSFFGSWCQGIHLMLLFAWTSFTEHFHALHSLLSNLLELLEFLKHGYYFAANRFYPFCTFFSVLRQNCVLPWIDWKDLIFFQRFVFVLSICFSYSIFSLYSIFNEHWIRNMRVGNRTPNSTSRVQKECLTVLTTAPHKWGRHSFARLLATMHIHDFSSPSRKALSWKMVEMMGIEPMTPCLQGRCSPSWATPPYMGSSIPENWTTIQETHAVPISLFQGFVLVYFQTSRNTLMFLTFSIERRWSSRTFRYGYLVTT